MLVLKQNTAHAVRTCLLEPIQSFCTHPWKFVCIKKLKELPSVAFRAEKKAVAKGRV